MAARRTLVEDQATRTAVLVLLCDKHTHETTASGRRIIARQSVDHELLCSFCDKRESHGPRPHAS